MTEVEYVIVGAGPAGLQMGYFLENAGRDYVILEAKESAGAFFKEHPRHRSLLSLNKRHNGFDESEFNMRHDWNSLLTNDGKPRFGEYSQDLYPSADALVRYFEDYAEEHRLKILYGKRVAFVERLADGRFRVELQGSQEPLVCRTLIMGTGATTPYMPPDIEGIDLVPGYEDHVLDPKNYENQSVLIIGRGNSAFETANHLAGSAAIIHIAIGNRPIELAWETHSVRNLRAINNTIVEMFHVKALHGALGLNVRKIRKAEGGGFNVIADEEVPNWSTPGMLELDLHYDHVIRCTGFKYVTPDIFAPDIRPEQCAKSKYPVLDPMWQSSTPDLYYIGTAMAARDKKSASSFIHGFRYNIRVLHHLLEQKNHGVPLSRREYSLSNVGDLDVLATDLLTRLSTTAALYQQFGFLCDVIRFGEGRCDVFQELPIDFVKSDDQFKDAECITINFEYGFHRYPKGTSSLSFITQMDEQANRRCAAFLQPVFRHYKNGELVGEDNLGDSLMLRYGPHRKMVYAQNEASPEDVERNILMNILNRASRTTDEVFDEHVLLKSHVFKTWPEGRPIDAEGLPRCSAVIAAAMGGE